MVSKKYYNLSKITLAIQAFNLRRQFPKCTCKLRHNKLTWYGKIRPTPFSKTYCIKLICHNLSSKPTVILYGDYIEGIDRSDFPHHFKIDKEKMEVELCLHMPYEFNHTGLIANTIIPWAQEWLFFYEIWLATGEWCGGGHKPKV